MSDEKNNEPKPEQHYFLDSQPFTTLYIGGPSDGKVRTSTHAYERVMYFKTPKLFWHDGTDPVSPHVDKGFYRLHAFEMYRGARQCGIYIDESLTPDEAFERLLTTYAEAKASENHGR